ncbi:hypothetical protein QMY03_16010 [Arthrobacter sp. KFRI-F3372]|uniref:O-antigen ligase family protein n=1 Tax=Pseudarthrobacter oxydans TaxID=1671 RepID=UPI00279CFEF5|nr:hypothetical protein QMY03_16010 [Arthrobacter sp. KFRI-F3372]
MEGKAVVHHELLSATASPVVPSWFFLAFGTSALILGFLFCKGSISRVANLAILSVTVIPLLPGFTEQRQPQVMALILVTAALLTSAYATAKTRGIRLDLAITWFAVLATLTLLTVGVIETDFFRMLVGLLTATIMALAIVVGNAASRRELASIGKVLTSVACLAAIIAIMEYFNKAPLYVFTEFQEPGNGFSVFRASAFLGHPLVLCIFLTGVSILNLSGPLQHSAHRKIWKLVCIVVPLAGASATVSRSLWVFVAVGLGATMFARSQGKKSKTAAFLVATVASIAGLALSLGGGFGQRFGELSAQDQRIRLGGFDTVMQITTGHEVFLGAGPKAVAKAFSNNVEGVIYGTVDNQFFTMFAEYGLIGMVLIVSLFVLLVRAVRAEHLDSLRISFVLGAIPSAAGFFLMEPVAWPLLCIIFGIGVGIASRFVRTAASSPDRISLAVQS